MDLLYFVKVILSPIIYLVKGLKFIFDWFYDKWNDLPYDKSYNLEDSIVIGVLYTLFLIILIPVILSPLLLVVTLVTYAIWLVLSIIGILVSLAWGWIWITDF